MLDDTANSGGWCGTPCAYQNRGASRALPGSQIFRIAFLPHVSSVSIRIINITPIIISKNI
jgi:hypothetical protein